MEKVIELIATILTIITLLYLYINLLVINCWRLITFEPLYTMEDMYRVFKKDINNILRKDD